MSRFFSDQEVLIKKNTYRKRSYHIRFMDYWYPKELFCCDDSETDSSIADWLRHECAKVIRKGYTHVTIHLLAILEEGTFMLMPSENLQHIAEHLLALPHQIRELCLVDSLNGHMLASPSDFDSKDAQENPICRHIIPAIQANPRQLKCIKLNDAEVFRSWEGVTIEPQKEEYCLVM